MAVAGRRVNRGWRRLHGSGCRPACGIGEVSAMDRRSDDRGIRADRLAFVTFACAVRDIPIPGIAGQSRRPGQAAVVPPPPASKTVADFRPFDLEIHQALMPADGAPAPSSTLPLTPYLQRGHDRALRAALEDASTGGPSVFAVLKGDSCTGKTRALYEALHDLVPGWPMLRPADADELSDLLEKGRFTTGTVLWLNETQRHLYGAAGEHAASRLKETLSTTVARSRWVPCGLTLL